MNSKKCKHPSCTCVVTDKDAYCSQICKDSQGRIELTCECGHSGCRGAKLTTP